VERTKVRVARWKAVASLVLAVPSIPLAGVAAPAALILAFGSLVDAIGTSSVGARRLSGIALGAALGALLAAGLLLSAFIGPANCEGTGGTTGACRLRDLPTFLGWLVINVAIGFGGLTLANRAGRRADRGRVA
jgi:hypothetical protein